MRACTRDIASVAERIERIEEDTLRFLPVVFELFDRTPERHDEVIAVRQSLKQLLLMFRHLRSATDEWAQGCRTSHLPAVKARAEDVAIVWADYRHESTTLMEAHAVHLSRVGTGATAGPMDPWTLPDAATQRSPRMHAVADGAVLVVVVIVINLTLQGLVLRPIAAMRKLIAALEHGHWRGQEMGATSGRDDEVGALYDGFLRLGSEIDALVGQLLHADRLATLALVWRRVEARVEPEIRRIGEIAGRLTCGEPTDAREGERLGRAAANILRAVHEYDAVFERRPGGGSAANGRTRDAA